MVLDNLDNKDIVKIESYLEDCVKRSMGIIPELNSFGIAINGVYSKELYIRVSLHYDDLIKGRDIIQPRMKEVMKEVFELDDIRLERCYEACHKNEENLYEILYNISDEKFEWLYILSKVNKNY